MAYEAVHRFARISARKVRPIMDSVFPFREAAKAHARMESSVHVGKIVLDMEAAP